MCMEIVFVRDGLAGRVWVTCVPNDDPPACGTPDLARGFPACTATIDYGGRGYRAMFGWVQLVQSSDNELRGAGFESDPFVVFADSTAPYCWYGTTPTLFDAPWRTSRRPLTWLAHSFLAWTPLDPVGKTVIPLLDFSWGFTIDDRGEIALQPVEQLAADAWDTHVPYLQARYPGWTYGSGFASG
jgi:hypothetical protein